MNLIFNQGIQFIISNICRPVKVRTQKILYSCNTVQNHNDNKFPLEIDKSLKQMTRSKIEQGINVKMVILKEPKYSVKCNHLLNLTIY